MDYGQGGLRDPKNRCCSGQPCLLPRWGCGCSRGLGQPQQLCTVAAGTESLVCTLILSTLPWQLPAQGRTLLPPYA